MVWCVRCGIMWHQYSCVVMDNDWRPINTIISLNLTPSALRTPCQAAAAAALKAAMDKRSIELLEAAIPKAEGYGIDTTEAKEALKVSEGSCRVRGMVRLGS